MHRHSREDEAFYILDGQVSVYVGDDVVRAGAGDFLWAPTEDDVVSSMTTRRYEVLLPARFNNGREVVETCMRCLPDTVMEVVDRFGALTFDPRPANGVWTQMGMR